MLACCMAMLSWLGGCVGLPFPQRRTGVGAEPGAANSSGSPGHIALASATETAGELPVSSIAPRSFPQQGWWCSEYEEWLAPERVEKGYTIILPGVEGTSWFNISIARGLVDAGHESAIEISDWTTGYWPMFVYHLMALERNRTQAREIAARIAAYQDRYPGRPVTLIGHSGGAAMAVLVLEALPEDRRVTQGVLLAGALSPDYDLSTALSRTERGISNFYSGGDVLYLVAGTLALGTLDRQHAVSAGAVGFRTPAHLSDERKAWYESLLHEEPYRFEMFRSLNFGGHFGPANRKFVADWVAPRLVEER
jgi:pimeloyl-ACP methyl ester carboxylesterase